MKNKLSMLSYSLFIEIQNPPYTAFISASGRIQMGPAIPVNFRC